MDQAKLAALLEEVAAGVVSAADAASRLRGMPFEDLEFAKVDHHRALRKGYPETIFCAGKTPEQVAAIVGSMYAHGSNIFGTRCSPEAARFVQEAHPEIVYHELARALTLVQDPPPIVGGTIGVVCAGTSDIPVAEEAVLTCEMLGNRVERIYDVGVAGIHRLFNQRPRLDACSVIIVCAGMEGALPSVLAGLVECPVIAVPTSVGYGASFQGLAALLGMLNSCATGLTVVNIDNGFGAGVAAAPRQRMIKP